MHNKNNEGLLIAIFKDWMWTLICAQCPHFDRPKTPEEDEICRPLVSFCLDRLNRIAKELGGEVAQAAVWETYYEFGAKSDERRHWTVMHGTDEERRIIDKQLNSYVSIWGGPVKDYSSFVNRELLIIQATRDPDPFFVMGAIKSGDVLLDNHGNPQASTMEVLAKRLEDVHCSPTADSVSGWIKRLKDTGLLPFGPDSRTVLWPEGSKPNPEVIPEEELISLCRVDKKPL